MKELVSFFGPNLETLLKKWKMPQQDLEELLHLGRGIVSGYIQKKSLARPVTIVFLEELTGVPMYRWLKTYIEADELPAGPQKTHLPALHEPGAAYTGAATVNNTPLPSLLRDLSDRLRALEDRVGELENCQ